MSPQRRSATAATGQPEPQQQPYLQARRRRAVTMKDIAETVGVSKMTVSAVLSGAASPRITVSEGTRERVLDAAREMGYRPNALARSLRSKRTNVVGRASAATAGVSPGRRCPPLARR